MTVSVVPPIITSANMTASATPCQNVKRDRESSWRKKVNIFVENSRALLSPSLSPSCSSGAVSISSLLEDVLDDALDDALDGARFLDDLLAILIAFASVSMSDEKGVIRNAFVASLGVFFAM